MAAEIDVSLSVRAIEELTYISSLDDGLLLIKMRPSYNVIGRHPNKTPDWQRSYFFIKCVDSAFEDPPDDDYRVLWNTLLGRTSSLARIISSYANCLLLFFLLCSRPFDFSRLSGRLSYERSCRCETCLRTLGEYFLGKGSPFNRPYFPE